MQTGVRLTIALLIGFATLAGCTEVRTVLLRHADAAADVDRALAHGDRRYLGVYGVGFTVPGVPAEIRNSLQPGDTQSMPGTSDIVHGDSGLNYQIAAQDYAERYNLALMARLKAH